MAQLISLAGFRNLSRQLRSDFFVHAATFISWLETDVKLSSTKVRSTLDFASTVGSRRSNTGGAPLYYPFLHSRNSGTFAPVQCIDEYAPRTPEEGDMHTRQATAIYGLDVEPEVDGHNKLPAESAGLDNTTTVRSCQRPNRSDPRRHAPPLCPRPHRSGPISGRSHRRSRAVVH